MEHAILSVPLPVKVKADMARHREIRWVEVARQAIIRKLSVLEKMDDLLAESEFSERDALEHGHAVSKKAWAKSQKRGA